MTQRRLLGAALLIVATIILTPLLYGVGKGLLAGTSEDERRSQAFALLTAYRDHWPPPVMMATLDTETAIRDCGYSSETLFVLDQSREDARAGRWTPRDGYMDIWFARSREWRRLLDELRIVRLSEGTSAFSSEFLRVCIRQSLFAPLCASQVGLILASADLDPANGNAWPRNQPRPDQSRETRNICTYLDGIAARRGLPLAARPQ